MSIHSVKRSQCHLAWDNSIEPILRIKSGEEVTFDCLDASNGQITPDSKSSVVAKLNLSSVDQVNGPIFVDGAVPGDTLQVEVLKIQTADWGWTALIPGFGLLSDEFKDPELKIYQLNTSEGYTWFNKSKGIKIPLRPFAGEMGVAPGNKGAFSTIPPYATGGNIDARHITAGSTLYLPIEVEGALFSIGDGHAHQGDGEVCGTAIETPMTVTVRLTVRKDRSYTKTPHFLTTLTSASALSGEHYCVTGVHPDLREATRSAVRNMVEFLQAEHGLDRVEGYMLCSVAGDLRLLEVVDMPNYLVGMMLPKTLLPTKQ